ncbi:GTP cyclohydrolase [Moritella sp. Urea-trap-13]|uniref:GTP cyclohydrolase n=1 Tax=Moritella sp. Urea-trap-13 TaxID=2058327 RepID=UPI000C32546C|nr:GTP cyclohydrolase [Moritella sp. Urea-trap-13]PKH06968.1 GTP cyclohydrolase [Moritella sp. Urea-trap-13]
MKPILKLTTLWRLNYQHQQFAQQLLLCFFAVCLVATTSFIVTNANSSYAQDMALLTIYDDNPTQGLVNVDGIYADAINIDRQARVDVALVKEQLKYEQTLADLGFVLEQYQMMELQAFKFVIDVPTREQVATVMLMHLQKMLIEFTALNPDINASWRIDPNNALRLIVQLHTERQRNWGRAGFMI